MTSDVLSHPLNEKFGLRRISDDRWELVLTDPEPISENYYDEEN